MNARNLITWVGLTEARATRPGIGRIAYLDQCIFAVYIAVIALTENLNILLEFLCFCHTHDTPPLIMNLYAIHVAISLLLLLFLHQTQSVKGKV